MNIGDTLRLTPTFDKVCDVLDRGPMRCEVVYIHPLGRFYVVEFRSALGVPWRETFYFEAQSAEPVNGRAAPRLPAGPARRMRRF